MDYEVILNTKEARDQFTEQGYANSDIALTENEMKVLCQLLMSGMCIGLYDGEHTTTIRLKGEDEGE